MTPEEKKQVRQNIIHVATGMAEDAGSQIEDVLIEDTLIDRAATLLYFARSLNGTACEECQCTGRKTYGSTATWRRGIGGQAITEGVCDVCWGTGRSDVKGVNLRLVRMP